MGERTTSRQSVAQRLPRIERPLEVDAEAIMDALLICADSAERINCARNALLKSLMRYRDTAIEKRAA